MNSIQEEIFLLRRKLFHSIEYQPSRSREIDGESHGFKIKATDHYMRGKFSLLFCLFEPIHETKAMMDEMVSILIQDVRKKFYRVYQNERNVF